MNAASQWMLLNRVFSSSRSRLVLIDNSIKAMELNVGINYQRGTSPAG